MMTEENQPKRMTGVLISGVIYLDDQGNTQEVYWCMTADGDSAPADIQPVIRTGSLGEAHELLPTMLVELQDRFAQAAAVEMAKALRSKKHSSTTLSKPANKPTAMDSESKDLQDSDDEETLEPEDRLDTTEQIEAEGESSLENMAEPEEEPVPAVRSSPPVEKKARKTAPAMASLFDGLDENLPADEAQALADRFEFYYTPKSASWLNMIEIEFSALARWCLVRRIPTLEQLEREVLSRVAQRKADKIKITWQFSVQSARSKLNSHYVKVQPDNQKFEET